MQSDGNDAVNLSGWKLQDRANHSVSLSGSIAAGAKRKIELADGQMPLNQGGYEIRLLNPAGETVHTVTYSGSQVQPGQTITFGP